MVRRVMMAVVMALAACSPQADVDDETPLDTDVELDLTEVLGGIEGITVVNEQRVFEHYTTVWFTFTQPVDHDDPSAGTFEQQAILSHTDFEAPMVLESTGYGLFGPYLAEPTTMLSANQLSTEKRYYNSSKPEGDVDWTTMTTAQIAADSHALVQALKPLYPGGWVNTGGSMGGIDSLHHRFHYPDDVNATVAYVAPLVNQLEDPRSLPFFEDEARADCVDKLHDVQVALLSPEALRADFIAEVELRAIDYELTFERVGSAELAAEGAVVSMPFTFWQYYGAFGTCSNLLAREDDASILEFGLMIWEQGTGADGQVEGFLPFYYQCAAEVGTVKIATDAIDGLFDAESYATPLLPDGAEEPTFNPVSLPLTAWLQTEGDHILLINGALDPLTSFSPDVSAAVGDVRKYTAPTTAHLSRVTDLVPDKRDEVDQALWEWTHP